MQHIGDIPRGHVLHGHMRALRIVKHHVLAARVQHLGVGARLTVDAFVCERRIGRRHCADGHAVRQAAERQRCKRDVGERFALGVDII